MASTPTPAPRYPATLSAANANGNISNRPTPLHRRGTSSKYESLEDLLLEHGYKDVRVLTPLAERLRDVSTPKNGRRAETPKAVDLLRTLVSSFALPPPPSPSLAHHTSPVPPSPSPAPTPALSFLAKDPYSRPTRSLKPKPLHHARSNPSLPRRPLTPLTNRPVAVAAPLLTPTRVHCHSHSRPHPRRAAHHPASPLTPPILAPSPPPSPSLPRAIAANPHPHPHPPPRHRSIRSLRAHLQVRAESPEPDFSDLGGGWARGAGEGEELRDEQEEWAGKWGKGKGRVGRRRMGLPWGWGG